MLKKLLFVWLIVMLLVSLFSLACATTPTPTPKPTPTPAPTPAPAPAPVINLKFGVWTAPDASFSLAHLWYLDEVEKRTGGRVKFQRYFNASLFGSDQGLDALKNSITDLTSVAPSYYPGKAPLGDVGSLPGLATNFWAGMMAFRETSQLPALQEEAAKWNARYLAAGGVSNYVLLMNKPVRTLDDLKGKKIRGTGIQAELLAALGVVTVTMPPTEVLTAIERGTIDGYMGGPAAQITYGIHNVAKYLTTNIPMGCMTDFPLAIRADAWSKLPPDIQSIMEKTATESYEAFARIYSVEGDAISFKKMKEAGVQFLEWPEADVLKAKAAARTVGDNWAKGKEASGLPGKMVLDFYIKAYEKYVLQSPSIFSSMPVPK